MKKEVIPGEWLEEIDPFTKAVKRYRMVGNVKEYEMMVTIDGCQVPESQVEAFNKRKKERQEQKQAELKAQQAQQPTYSCPFNGNGLNPVCRAAECAFFKDNNCIIRQIKTDPMQTEGKRCPVSMYNKPCNSKCAFYNGGCILTGIINKLAERK